MLVRHVNGVQRGCNLGRCSYESDIHHSLIGHERRNVMVGLPRSLNIVESVAKHEVCLDLFVDVFYDMDVMSITVEWKADMAQTAFISPTIRRVIDSVPASEIETYDFGACRYPVEGSVNGGWNRVWSGCCSHLYSDMPAPRMESAATTH